jgi:small subunit ribosomal protein S20
VEIEIFPIFVAHFNSLKNWRHTMAHHKSAIKRIRQSRKRKIYNRGNKKTMREAIKAVRTATTVSAAQEALKAAFSILDRVAARGIIKKNNAANKKSRLAKAVKKLEATA